MNAQGGEKIRIRMYRVGFGDCFLVSLPDKDRQRHLLIDCGVHARGNLDTIGAAVDDIQQETGGEIDLVVASHAHQDHISGFGECAEKFRRMTVREVWLPWTENAADAEAARLKKKQMALVDTLRRHFAALGGARYGAAQSALLNLASNAKAMDLLKRDLRAKVQYLEAGHAFTDAAGVAGLSVKVLGPPRDQKFLARMDPPAAQRYLRMNNGDVEETGAIQPFPKRWQYDYGKSGPLSEKDLKYLAELAAGGGEELAFALDQAINNTSLVLLITWRGQSMLFPGDAQYGNWQSWVEQPGAGELLESVRFLKVSHHGSENATPKSALEGMPEGKFAAMVSTQNKPWPSIPYGKLIDALERRTAKRVVRSDALAVKGAPALSPLGALPSGFVKGPLWFDYTIPVEVV